MEPSQTSRGNTHPLLRAEYVRRAEIALSSLEESDAYMRTRVESLSPVHFAEWRGVQAQIDSLRAWLRLDSE